MEGVGHSGSRSEYSAKVVDAGTGQEASPPSMTLAYNFRGSHSDLETRRLSFREGTQVMEESCLEKLTRSLSRVKESTVVFDSEGISLNGVYFDQSDIVACLNKFQDAALKECLFDGVLNFVADSLSFNHPSIATKHLPLLDAVLGLSDNTEKKMGLIKLIARVHNQTRYDMRCCVFDEWALIQVYLRQEAYDHVMILAETELSMHAKNLNIDDSRAKIVSYIELLLANEVVLSLSLLRVICGVTGQSLEDVSIPVKEVIKQNQAMLSEDCISKLREMNKEVNLADDISRGIAFILGLRSDAKVKSARK